MLDINLVRQQPDLVKKALKDRQKDPSLVDQVLTLDVIALKLSKQIEDLRASQNIITKDLKGKPTSDQLAAATKIKSELKSVENELLKNNAEKFP